jgi:hypothetical protein
MKKIITSFLFILFSITIFAQEEVTFNLSRKKAAYGLAATARIFINGKGAANLKNGRDCIYKVPLDVSQPVTVLVKCGQIKQEITFLLSPGNKCDIEIVLSNGGNIMKLLSGGKIMEGTGLVAGLKTNKEDLSISYTSTKILSSDTIRLKWLEKGGHIVYRSIAIGGTFISSNISGTKSNMGGVNFAGNMTMLNFKVPEYKPGIRKWHTAIFGSSIYLNFFKTESMSTFNFNNTLNFGYTFGAGKYKSETNWKGGAFELSYKPGWQVSVANGNGDFSLNLAGFGFDYNFNNFTSNASKLAPRAQSKFSCMILPPLKNKTLFVSISYGISFYGKQ